jgi:ubiquinone/menaquinone biosynthesis C-methylase UbiE
MSTCPDKIPLTTSYEPFSREPEYIEANRQFLGAIAVRTGDRLLDIACGTGTLSELIRERESGLATVGVDISRESLLLAREALASPDVVFIESRAEMLPVRSGSVDLALMGNSIHMVSDETVLLREVTRVLRPGGIFAFNTSFYAGTFVAGTERFYHEWLKQALALVQQGDGRRERRRGTAQPAFSKRWLSSDEWMARLADAGLQPTSVRAREVLLRQRSFETIGAYAGFAEVLLSGYRVERASEALQASAGPALAAVGMTLVPRYWLEVIATKPASEMPEPQTTAVGN